MLAFVGAVAASVILPRLPYGRELLYPFSLLGTWAHEMGHGLTAEILGGGFEELELYRNLGGVAFTRTSSGFRHALVSFGGLLGPAFGGAIMVWFGARVRTARWVLAALVVGIGLSLLLYIRNGFGFMAMTAIGAVLGAIAWFGPNVVKILLTQFIGVQFAMSSWGTLDYMFTKDFRRDGQTFNSDTQNIAEELLLPYWFWGGLSAVLSALILAAAFWFAWVRPLRDEDEPTPNLI